MTSQHISIQAYQNIILVVFEKDRIVEVPVITELGQELMKINDSAAKPSIVIDLHKVKNMSSMMIAKIIALHKAVKKNKGRIALTNLSASMRPLVKVTKLDKLVDIYPEAEEALQYYRRTAK